ncbi:MAG: lysylphosphatidylglycerol synthase transmembrane domain-containing protein [Bacteroidetes bacterium]|nr:lysylphosphatidylglycerol synthase transmembrane domain-containing protein [Bacteroidota bacterium]
MLHPKTKQLLQVTLSLGIALWIFWFLYRDIEFEQLQSQLASSNWFWILLSLLIAWTGYWLRGWRWALLFRQEADQLPVSSNQAYHAVMVGYLVNLLIPRAGEVARCTVLTRNNGIPLGQAIGTVLVERSVDLLFMASTIFIAFLLENQLFISLVGQLVNLSALTSTILRKLPLLLGCAALFFIFLSLLGRKYRNHGLVNKFQVFFRQLLSGVRAIGHLKNPMGFWISSVIIWIIYFLTLYTVSQGIGSSANLSGSQVLLVMVMGTIGMIAPVQGGIGTFHAMVAYILVIFGIPEADGKIFAAIVHCTQMLLIIGVGLISWILMLKTSAWKKPLTS